MAIGAVAGMGATYVLMKEKMRTAAQAEDGTFDDGDDIRAARKQAIKDVIRAGKEMKNAWDRIQRDMKIIAKKSLDKMAESEDKEEEG